MRLKILMGAVVVFVGSACGLDLNELAANAGNAGIGARQTLPPAQCEAYPSCDAGDTQVSSSTACLQDDAACYERTLCGTTIWCTGPRAPVQCAAVPVCDGGDTEIPNSTACLQDDAACYERTVCGSTIWCTGPRPEVCEAYPSCEPGDLQVIDPSGCAQDDATCYERTVCGTTIWCTGTCG